MHGYDQIVEYLWRAQPLLCAAVVLALWRRGLRKKFPIFFTYLLAQIAIFGITYPLRGANHYELFFYVYWSGAAVSALLGFRVIHEIFLDVFRPYDTLKDLGTVLFKWAGVVMLMVSVVVAFSNSSVEDPLVQAVTTLQRSVRLVQCGLILFLLLFSRFLGLSRRQQSFGIALGFGLFATTELVLIVLNAGSYLKVSIASLFNLAAYDVSIAVWLAYVLAPSLSRDVAPNHLQTKRWEQTLADLHTSDGGNPLSDDALIPMFEGMVERAFSRGSTVDGTNGNKSASAAKAGSKTTS